MQHKEIKETNVHIIHNMKFSTTTERDSYMPTQEDLYKICLVMNPYHFFSLKSVEPIEWEPLGQNETTTKSAFDYKLNENPTININPSQQGSSCVNIVSGEIFICTDITQNKNIWIGTKATIIMPKPIFKFDIFDDLSAKSFLKLDGDMSDIGGIYNITTANLIFENGKSEKCVKSINDNAKIDINGKMKSISFFAYFPQTVTHYGYFFDCRSYGNNAYCYLSNNVTPLEINQCQILIDGAQINTTQSFPKEQWVHITINFNTETNGIILLNNSSPSYGITNAKIDHIRSFNRPLTITEIQTLKVEI